MGTRNESFTVKKTYLFTQKTLKFLQKWKKFTKFVKENHIAQ